MKEVERMNNNLTETACQLWDGATNFLIAGSSYFMFMDVFHINMAGITGDPVDLSDCIEINFLVAPYSVLREKNFALIHKTLSSGDIILLPNAQGIYNRLQCKLLYSDTLHLNGSFRWQCEIIDGLGEPYTPKQGLLIFDSKIQTQGW
jgi:hypothetical protein